MEDLSDILEDETPDEFAIDYEESVEIDYSDYGFVLRSPLYESNWRVIPNDPDEEESSITADSKFPVQVYSIQITKAEYDNYENLRLSLSNH